MTPGLDGVEVLRRVWDDARMATVRVLMYPALSNQKTTSRALAAGANGYVVKGVEFDDLRATLAKDARCNGG
jgi:DNA-binding response OmpR family regulator